MLTTSHPAAENHLDSARVENRGPWMTTTVPVSCTTTPSVRAASTAALASSGQYGSANDTWAGSGPSKNVSARPEVRSTSWSQTTKWPGFTWGWSDPTEHGASTR